MSEFSDRVLSHIQDNVRHCCIRLRDSTDCFCDTYISCGKCEMRTDLYKWAYNCYYLIPYDCLCLKNKEGVLS